MEEKVSLKYERHRNYNILRGMNLNILFKMSFYTISIISYFYSICRWGQSFAPNKDQSTTNGGLPLCGNKWGEPVDK